MYKIADVVQNPDKHKRHQESFHVLFKFPDHTRISFEITCCFCLRNIRNLCFSIKRYLPESFRNFTFDVRPTQYVGYEITNYVDFYTLVFQNLLNALRYPYLYNLYFINHEKDFCKELVTRG